jgi:RNA polymerase sigma factor (sigma-70 family)
VGAESYELLSKQQPPQAEMHPEAWATAALKSVEQEIHRLRRLRKVPDSLNDDDLRSAANEILAGIVGAPEDHVRRLLRCRLIDCIKREVMTQHQEVHAELLPQNDLPEHIGDLEFEQLIADLTNKQREAIILFYLAGETAASAAEMLGVPLPTFKDRLKKAVAAMRKKYFSS